MANKLKVFGVSALTTLALWATVVPAIKGIASAERTTDNPEADRSRAAGAEADREYQHTMTALGSGSWVSKWIFRPGEFIWGNLVSKPGAELIGVAAGGVEDLNTRAPVHVGIKHHKKSPEPENPDRKWFLENLKNLHLRDQHHD